MRKKYLWTIFVKIFWAHFNQNQETNDLNMVADRKFVLRCDLDFICQLTCVNFFLHKKRPNANPNSRPSSVKFHQFSIRFQLRNTQLFLLTYLSLSNDNNNTINMKPIIQIIVIFVLVIGVLGSPQSKNLQLLLLSFKFTIVGQSC